MRRLFWGGGLVVLVFAAWAAAESKEAKSPAATAQAGLERLKKLAGEWVAADDQGQPTTKVVSIFKITAGGSAVQETLFPGSDHEMITMYTTTGGRSVGSVRSAATIRRATGPRTAKTTSNATTNSSAPGGSVQKPTT